MKAAILPGSASGTVTAPPSKSLAHRTLLCAALAGEGAGVFHFSENEDILATLDCIRALGSEYVPENDGIRFTRVLRPDRARAHADGEDDRIHKAALCTDRLFPVCPCRESGSTLRFLLPLALLLRGGAVFTGSERLMERGIGIYEEVLTLKGVRFSKNRESVTVSGALLPGDYVIRGDVSSQFVSGLLFALPFLDGDSTLTVLPPVESQDYIRLTTDVLCSAGIQISFGETADRVENDRAAAERMEESTSVKSRAAPDTLAKGQTAAPDTSAKSRAAAPDTSAKSRAAALDTSAKSRAAAPDTSAKDQATAPDTSAKSRSAAPDTSAKGRPAVEQENGKPVENALRNNGIRFHIPGAQRCAPRCFQVEGDWSNGAFLHALNYLGGKVEIRGLKQDSLQGDRICLRYFDRLFSRARAAAESEAVSRYRRYFPAEPDPIDLTDCPDLGPLLFALAAASGYGGSFSGTRRLRLKESDRARVMAEELRKFGVKTIAEENRVTVLPGRLCKPTCELDAHNDHRIVMALALLCTRTGGTIRGAEAVRKSWPDFFDMLRRLGIQVFLQ